MKFAKILKIFSLTFLLPCCFASAEIRTLGADGPAAVSFIADVLLSNVDGDNIDCELEYSVIAKQILSVSANKKLVSAGNNKNVKNFLKQIGAPGAPTRFFSDAALEAATVACEEGEPIDDGSGDEFVE